MNLGIWYVCNMHESFLSKIHPFSVVAKPDMKIVMKRDSGRLALLGDSASVSRHVTADVLILGS